MKLFIILSILFLLYYLWGRFILKDPSGNTTRVILKSLKVKGKTCFFNPFNLTIRKRQSDFKIVYHMISGKGYYIDTDFDGCSSSNSFNFTIELDKKKNMIMVRTTKFN